MGEDGDRSLEILGRVARSRSRVLIERFWNRALEGLKDFTYTAKRNTERFGRLGSPLSRVGISGAREMRLGLVLRRVVYHYNNLNGEEGSAAGCEGFPSD